MGTVTRVTFDLSLCQLEVYLCEARFRVLVAGRRFGKTYLAIAEMLRAALLGPDKTVWYVGPNDHQSKDIAWDLLKALTQRWWAKTPNETELRIDLQNGSKLIVSGAFKPDTLRGRGIDFLVLDEFASLPASAWNQVFRPMLADRMGSALLIGTPKGRNHFYDHFEYAKTDPDWAAFQFTTADGGIVPLSELESAARQLDPDTYKQELEGVFTAIGKNRVYYAFDRAKNIQPLTFDVMHPLIWSIDFNVNPMCMLLIQRVGDMVHVLQEIIIRPDANTEAACQAFVDHAQPLAKHVPYNQQPLRVLIYGDANGHQRRTAAVETDWTIIRHFFKLWVGVFAPSHCYAHTNPAVRDRINCVNSMLRTQSQETRLLIDPSCKELIKDLEQVTWAVDSTGAATTELNKSDPARTHASDALGYFISRAFPLKPQIGHQDKGPILG